MGMSEKARTTSAADSTVATSSKPARPAVATMPNTSRLAPKDNKNRVMGSFHCGGRKTPARGSAERGGRLAFPRERVKAWLEKEENRTWENTSDSLCGGASSTAEG